MSNILKLSAQRYKESSPSSSLSNSYDSLLLALESDRGRVLNSAAVRRLQQKTQVFPLEKNAAVRSRLTHSLEVMQVGRFISQTICRLAAEKINGTNDQQHSDEQSAYKTIENLGRALETTVEMACVLHDVGNPPFGHFGEQAINQWFEANLLPLYKKQSKQALTTQEQDIMADAMHFEGNAQAIRLVHHLLDLNLTNSLVASILKYTRCGTEPKPTSNKPLSYLKKKVGYYFSEKAFVEQLQESLNIPHQHRHPATYIMEAADDISYCMADLEDAVEKGILSVDELVKALKDEYQAIIQSFELNTLGNSYEDASIASNAQYSEVDGPNKMAHICDQAYSEFEQEDIVKVSAFFIKFRVKVVHPLVVHASTVFIDNLSAITQGSFNQALLEDKSYAHAISKTLKNVALKHVFCVAEVETAELQGYQILQGLLNKFSALLMLSADEFTQVCTKGDFAFPLETRLVKRIGKKHVARYLKVVQELSNSNQALASGLSFTALEFYYRARLIQDHVSGMTDQYSLEEYRTLMALV
ncbi:dGTPase [Glaciecola sp. 2405UD65-10]|uniref:dGTPase n=1 Tax=Glaciecola sp. 2405UD65-10 TaxID=3397244 RepID=UPI003B5CDB47